MYKKEHKINVIVTVVCALIAITGIVVSAAEGNIPAAIWGLVVLLQLGLVFGWTRSALNAYAAKDTADAVYDDLANEFRQLQEENDILEDKYRRSQDEVLELAEKIKEMEKDMPVEVPVTAELKQVKAAKRSKSKKKISEIKQDIKAVQDKEVNKK